MSTGEKNNSVTTQVTVTQPVTKRRMPAKPFLPGDNRINRKGRLDGGGSQTIRALFRDLGEEKVEIKGVVMTKREAIARQIIDSAIRGDDRKQRLYLEYVYGKPIQPVDVEARVGIAAFDPETMGLVQRVLGVKE